MTDVRPINSHNFAIGSHFRAEFPVFSLLPGNWSARRLVWQDCVHHREVGASRSGGSSGGSAAAFLVLFCRVPKNAPWREPGRSQAILVADVVGYSRLAGADEDRTLSRLRGLTSDLIDPAIDAHHGDRG